MLSRRLLNAIVLTCATALPLSVPAQQMVLRDAIYLYNVDFYDGPGTLAMWGEGCDVMQVVFDLDSGYVEFEKWEYNVADESSVVTAKYPDRIQATAKMFSYMLYTPDRFIRRIDFTGNDATRENHEVVGRGTLFGYCLSDDPDAKIFVADYARCTNTYSSKYASLSGAMTGVDCTPAITDDNGSGGNGADDTQPDDNGSGGNGADDTQPDDNPR
ncbi:MAG: hypothetical protein KDG55_08235 [Rhodocyclaceae bacterium]|nr:hypothetical protein [Rhodocyclaceae bacterium]